jgi:hypothetical protein
MEKNMPEGLQNSETVDLDKEKKLNQRYSNGIL